jgi:rhodanese-related sulfurtransferase
VGDFFSSVDVQELMAFAERHTLMVFVFFAVLCGLIYLQVRIMLANLKKLNINMANVMINHENGIYVDVRPANLFSQGHIAGSINIVLLDVKQGKLHRIDSYKDKPVIIVGKDKMDSDCFNAGVSLKKQGYTKVYLLEGGISQWAMENLPLSTKN